MTAAGLRLTRAQRDQIVAHALGGRPYEACGLLGLRGGALERFYPTTNKESSRYRYEIDPRELLRILPTVRLQLSDIQHLITDLHQKGLVHSNRAGQGAALLKLKKENVKKKFWQTLRSLLYLRLPGWDPERALTILDPIAGWLFKPWGLIRKRRRATQQDAR